MKQFLLHIPIIFSQENNRFLKSSSNFNLKIEIEKKIDKNHQHAPDTSHIHTNFKTHSSSTIFVIYV